jgi:hypothetical protein
MQSFDCSSTVSPVLTWKQVTLLGTASDINGSPSHMPLLLLLLPVSPQLLKLAAALISYSSKVCPAGASAAAAAAAISVLLRHQQLPPLLLLAPLDPAQPVTSFQSSNCTPMQGALGGLPSSEGLMAPTAS